MSTSIGRQAEAAAAGFLRKKGYKIIAQNWRTRWCEIDIVANKRHTVFFIEVKYRTTNTYGSGLDYITTRKLEQMHVAASFWMARHMACNDYRLSAIEVSGTDLRITAWLNDVSGT